MQRVTGSTAAAPDSVWNVHVAALQEWQSGVTGSGNSAPIQEACPYVLEGSTLQHLNAGVAANSKIARARSNLWGSPVLCKLRALLLCVSRHSSKALPPD